MLLKNKHIRTCQEIVSYQWVHWEEGQGKTDAKTNMFPSLYNKSFVRMTELMGEVQRPFLWLPKRSQYCITIPCSALLTQPPSAPYPHTAHAEPQWLVAFSELMQSWVKYLQHDFSSHFWVDGPNQLGGHCFFILTFAGCGQKLEARQFPTGTVGSAFPWECLHWGWLQNSGQGETVNCAFVAWVELVMNEFSLCRKLNIGNWGWIPL